MESRGSLYELYIIIIIGFIILAFLTSSTTGLSAYVPLMSILLGPIFILAGFVSKEQSIVVLGIALLLFSLVYSYSVF